MPTRKLLPQRRRAETFNMKFGDQNAEFAVTLGYYDDGRIGEVFIDGAKAGSMMAALTRDGSVLVSIGLQYGMQLETVRHALTRDRDGKAFTIVGAVIDKILEMENENQRRAGG
jgi:hypothetical protein